MHFFSRPSQIGEHFYCFKQRIKNILSLISGWELSNEANNLMETRQADSKKVDSQSCSPHLDCFLMDPQLEIIGKISPTKDQHNRSLSVCTRRLIYENFVLLSWFSYKSSILFFSKHFTLSRNLFVLTTRKFLIRKTRQSNYSNRPVFHHFSQCPELKNEIRSSGVGT